VWPMVLIPTPIPIHYFGQSSGDTVLSLLLRDTDDDDDEIKSLDSEWTSVMNGCACYSRHNNPMYLLSGRVVE
jgi:hypothetical protein